MRNTIKRFGSALLIAGAVTSLAACAAQPSRQVRLGHGDENTGTTARKPSLSSLEAAYKHNSNDPETALRYARGLRENGRLQRSAIVLGPFVQNNPKNADILAEYGATQAAMSNNTDAERYAHKAIAIDANNGEAYHVLGIALDAEGKHDQAETAFRTALKHWKGNPAPVLNNLGLNLAAQNFLDEAVETLRKAAADEPDSLEIKRNLRIVKAMQSQSPPHAKPVPVPPAKPPRS